MTTFSAVTHTPDHHTKMIATELRRLGYRVTDGKHGMRTNASTLAVFDIAKSLNIAVTAKRNT